MDNQNYFFRALIFLAIFSLFLPSAMSAQGSSQVSINLTSELSIRIVKSTIEFGDGRVDANATSAVLDSSIDLNFTWANVTPAVIPKGYVGGTMAFDSSRNKIVYFGGGQDGVNVLNETWEYDGTSWTNITTINAPSPRALANMVYDSGRKLMILFAGSNNGTEFSDTWEYNGSSATWTNISPATSPLARAAAGFAFVSSKNVAVLFDGSGCSGWCDDVWIYNTTTKDWLNVTPATVPYGRGYPGMVYDSSRDVVLIYGGVGASGTTNDTWELTPADWTFNKVSEGKYRLAALGMVYDSHRKKAVIFGGHTYNGTADFASNYTAEYDALNSQWSTFNLNNPFPTRVPYSGQAFDSYRNVIVMQGGVDNAIAPSQIYNETYEMKYVQAGGTLNGSWMFDSQYFYIENDGTVNETINVSVDVPASGFIGGTLPSFKIKSADAKTGACSGTAQTSYIELATGQQTVCSNLNYGNSADTIKTAIKLVIPDDAAPGQKTAIITFTAS